MLGLCVARLVPGKSLAKVRRAKAHILYSSRRIFNEKQHLISGLDLSSCA